MYTIRPGAIMAAYFVIETIVTDSDVGLHIINYNNIAPWRIKLKTIYLKFKVNDIRNCSGMIPYETF